MEPRTRGFTLIEILVVLVIVGILAAFLLPRYLGGAKDQYQRKVQSPMQRARSVECQNNLSQIRAAIQMATATSDSETRPRTLAELRPQGVTESMMSCPVGKVAYRYDPNALRVMCPYAGHQSY